MKAERALIELKNNIHRQIESGPFILPFNDEVPTIGIIFAHVFDANSGGHTRYSDWARRKQREL